MAFDTNNKKIIKIYCASQVNAMAVRIAREVDNYRCSGDYRLFLGVMASSDEHKEYYKMDALKREINQAKKADKLLKKEHKKASLEFVLYQIKSFMGFVLYQIKSFFRRG